MRVLVKKNGSLFFRNFFLVLQFRKKFNFFYHLCSICYITSIREITLLRIDGISEHECISKFVKMSSFRGSLTE